MKPIETFASLKQMASEGRDYSIESVRGRSGVAIMAPHGGGIEPGTDIIAKAIAGDDHSYYAFKGIKPRGNRTLHLASQYFDEPTAIALSQGSHSIITLHGFRKKASIIYVGGRDDALKRRIADNLSKHRFDVGTPLPNTLKGIHPTNLCNRGTRNKGVQLELSHGLRQQLLGDRFRGEAATAQALQLFVTIVRESIAV